ncbi:MAG: hydrogen gas-evolving membrane-bound hydrogenase subunit E [Bacteroidales bacterium]|nr:DUF4040 domain-containing protein [Bacteroidales bacterium]MDZ4203784.1 hydrogen gas-evolving membrane-bound hydrogenase subunit E [Bacteroidales bacterium]
MEAIIAVLLILMIAGSIYTLHARDLLSAIVSYGIVGFALVIIFLFLKAPDLAIVQLVVEIITLIIMIAVIRNSSKEDLQERTTVKVEGVHYINLRSALYLLVTGILCIGLFYYFVKSIPGLEPFGVHTTRMATTYIEQGAELTGSANLVTGILFDFRGYDTLGEATILLTAVIGILTILRIKGKKV